MSDGIYGPQPLPPDVFASAYESLHTQLGIPLPTHYPRKGSP